MVKLVQTGFTDLRPNADQFKDVTSDVSNKDWRRDVINNDADDADRSSKMTSVVATGVSDFTKNLFKPISIE